MKMCTLDDTAKDKQIGRRDEGDKEDRTCVWTLNVRVGKMLN